MATNFRKTVGEIFRLLDEAKTKKERLELLAKFDTAAVREIVRLNFSEKVKFLLPEGRPPYKPLQVPPNAPESGESNLWSEYKKLYLYIEGGHKTLSPIKREALFIQLLEGLHPQEAELLIKLKDKKLKCGLTRAVVDEAYPGLLPLVEKKTKEKDASSQETNQNGNGQGSNS
jgi:hypothetical protein